MSIVPDARLARLIRAGATPDDATVGALVEMDAMVLGARGAEEAHAGWTSALTGLGPLEPLVVDGVTDLLVNGDGSVWVDAGAGLRRADIEVGGPDAVRRLATRLAGVAGRRLDDSQPWVDGQLPGGIRLHAVLPPIAAGGPHVSLRLARRDGWTLEELAARRMVDPRMRQVLEAIVAARVSFLVTGGTGTGKTTLLAALLESGPAADRIVVVEDVRELSLRLPHVVSLQGRAANVEGVGSVTLVDLVRQALRMRPDRLVVGEARGAEVRELLAALNTGHAGGCATLHANRPADVPARLAALGALAGLSEEATAAQVASAVELVVHLGRDGPRRRVAEVALLDRGEVVAALVADGGTSRDGPGMPRLARLLAAGSGRSPEPIRSGEPGRVGEPGRGSGASGVDLS